MRSDSRPWLFAAALAAAVAQGCGNYSNDDVAFISAIPHGAALHVAVPALQSQPPVCANGTADTFVQARATGASINAGLDGMLALVDFVRGLDPTVREPDRRVWGPFPDGKHPGVEIEVIMVRRPDAAPGQTRFLYAFEARRAGPFIPILEGTFLGASAENGSGVLEVHFDNSHALAIDNPGDPLGLVDFFYDLASEPRTLSLQLNGDGFGLAAFAYQYAGYADGHALFDFVFSDASATRYFVATKFAASSAGRADVQYRTSAGATGSFVECWDAFACITYATQSNPPVGSLALCTLFP